MLIIQTQHVYFLFFTVIKIVDRHYLSLLIFSLKPLQDKFIIHYFIFSFVVGSEEAAYLLPWMSFPFFVHMAPGHITPTAQI